MDSYDKLKQREMKRKELEQGLIDYTRERPRWYVTPDCYYDCGKSLGIAHVHFPIGGIGIEGWQVDWIWIEKCPAEVITDDGWITGD